MALWPFNQQKAAPVRSATEAPSSPTFIYLNNGQAAAILSWSDAVAAQEAMKHPIIYRALNKIAESVQQMRWFAEIDPRADASDRSGKSAVIKDLQGVLDSPNEDMSPAMLRYWMALNYASYGRVPLNVRFSAMKPDRPNGLYPLEAQYVAAKSNARGMVDGYEYGMGETKQTFVARGKWVANTKNGFVDQIWKPSLRGYQHRDEKNTPLTSIGLPAQVIKSLMLRAIRSAEGHPNCRYMVIAEKELTAQQSLKLTNYLNNDFATEGNNSGGVPVLKNMGNVVIHKLDNDLSDIHSKMPSDDMARLIFGAFGIPIALAGMGAADSAKFAGNFDGSRLAFWQDTIIPGYIEPLFQGLTRMICPPGVRISADLDSVPALMAGRIAAMKDAAGVTFLTDAEKRELFGWGKIEAPANPTP